LARFKRSPSNRMSRSTVRFPPMRHSFCSSFIFPMVSLQTISSDSLIIARGPRIS